MTEHHNTPTTAFSLLEPFERQVVEDYAKFAISVQHNKRERIIHALSIPIPSEYVRRSKGALAKPLARAAVAELLQAASNEQDMSPDRIIQEHGVIAFSNIADYLVVRPFGDFSCKSLDEIPRHIMAAVKSMKTIPGPYGNRTEITLHDKLPSLKVLTELVGLVAPDRPPALAEYSRPVQTKAQQQGQAPETAYAALLESSQCRT